MRVLMFCPNFRPAIGGAERQAEKLAFALVRKGCEVLVLSPRIDDLSPDIEVVEGVRIERFKAINLAKYCSFPGVAFINIPFFLFQIFKAVYSRLLNVDVVHCHIGSLESAGAVLAARARGVPALVTAHTANWHSDLGNLKKRSRSGPAIARFVRAVLPRWVAISDAVEQELLKAGVRPSAIFKIPNGVEVPNFLSDRDLAPNVRKYLYLGRLTKGANRDVPTLISAFAKLASKHEDIELALVGGGDLLDHTRSLVEATSISARIHMPGFDDPAKWLAWADCFVLPSRYEGLSLALLEAMAAGLPCIANDIPPNREVLADGAAGVLVPVGDENSLYEALFRMASDAEFAVKMRSAAFDRVTNNYGIDVVAESYFRLYKK
ncbi:MAG TPA: glycosyltransferase family 4 protein [Accumulibacter sp.]|nr:glycosyltransferase family 4 protein [Accumulibacter sp.]